MARSDTPWYRGLGPGEILATVRALPGLLVDLIDRHERLRELVDGLIHRIRKLEAELAIERAKRRQLARRLAENSANSSRPPSLDNAATREARAKQRRGNGRKPGGQPGHPGHRREPVEEERVDEVRVVPPDRCDRCLKRLSYEEAQRTGQCIIWQQVEWDGPDEGRRIIEFHFPVVVCANCHAHTRAKWPPEARLCVGPRLHALVVVLSIGLRLTRRQVQEILGCLLGITLSVGTLQKLCEECGEALREPYERLEKHVRQAYAVNMDETSWRMGLERLWVWVAHTPLVTVIRITGSRAAKEVRQILGDSFAGTVMCDRYGGYRWLGRRSYCWAHLERAFVALADKGGEAGALGSRLLALTHDLFAAWHCFKAGEVDQEALKRGMKPLREQFRTHLQEMATNIEGQPGAMARNLLRDWEHLFRFVDEPGLEPTNNAAERALRALVIMRKLSYGNRSEKGCRFVERSYSLLKTLRQCEVDVLAWLGEALACHRRGEAAPQIPGLTAGDTPADESQDEQRGAERGTAEDAGKSMAVTSDGAAKDKDVASEPGRKRSSREGAAAEDDGRVAAPAALLASGTGATGLVDGSRPAEDVSEGTADCAQISDSPQSRTLFGVGLLAIPAGRFPRAVAASHPMRHETATAMGRNRTEVLRSRARAPPSDETPHDCPLGPGIGSQGCQERDPGGWWSGRAAPHPLRPSPRNALTRPRGCESSRRERVPC